MYRYSVIKSILPPTTVTVASGAASGTATISAVVVANTVIYVPGLIPALSVTGNGNFDAMAGAVVLTNSTTVTCMRGGSPAQTLTGKFQGIEFGSGIVKSITQVSFDMTGVSTKTASLPTVNTAKTIAFYQGYTLNSATTDNVDLARFSYVLSVTSATVATCDRNSTGFSPTVYAAYVEFK